MKVDQIKEQYIILEWSSVHEVNCDKLGIAKYMTVNDYSA